MNEPSSLSAGARPTLPDPWASAGSLPLDGPIERAVAASGVDSARAVGSGLLGLVVAFILFQLIISPVVTLGLLALKGVPLEAFAQPDSITALISENVRELILGNSFGQVFGLAIPAFLFARLHSSRVRSYLRIRGTHVKLLGLAVLGLVALTPLVQWLGIVNQSIPLPESLRTLEASQMELIEKVLDGGLGVGFNVAMLAVVPAICEELLFRGYAQRQFERGLSPAWGIALSGILFGLYHLRLSQVLPLSALGLFMAYLVWRTGSIWPAVIVHFANNAFSVILANYASNQPDVGMEALEKMEVPGYIVILSAVIFAGVLYVLHHTARTFQPHALEADT